MLSIVHDPVVAQVPAKVNLHLDVGEVRPDGYHGVTTVYQALSLYDTISVVPSGEPGVRVRGEGEREIPADRDNLAWRAVELLAERMGREPRVKVTVDKAIPVAGGLAGGSADAAGTLVALADMWGLEPAPGDLETVAARLGSDVPFLLSGGTALGTGRGEELTSVLARGEYHWVVAFAKGGLRTPDVYAELDRLRGKGSAGPARSGPPDALLQALAAGDPAGVAASLGNDLQVAALSLRPDVRRTLDAGERAGALRGVVSGSGPTCVFLCSDAESAVAVDVELAGEGVCRTVRVATGPVAGARIVSDDPGPDAGPEGFA